MLKKEAREITGGLSAPGKMPEGSYNLPAGACQTGAKLREVPDTPCYKCYAFKGRYNFSQCEGRTSQTPEEPRRSAMGPGYDSLSQKQESISAGTTQVISRASRISKKIFEVCNNTPATMHWLPTQERKYLPLGSYPANLTIRLSNAKNNTAPGQGLDPLVHRRRQRLPQLPGFISGQCLRDLSRMLVQRRKTCHIPEALTLAPAQSPAPRSPTALIHDPSWSGQAASNKPQASSLKQSFKHRVPRSSKL